MKTVTMSDMTVPNRIVSITFCEPGQLRVREVVTRSRARPTFKFPSVKAGRMMQAESENELNVFGELECDPRVKAYGEQPCRIVYIDGDQEKTHFPDLLVEPFESRKELWEVKEAKEAATDEVARRNEILSSDVSSYGYFYRIKIAEEARKQPGLANRTTILHFVHRPVSDNEREFVRGRCELSPGIRWGEACAGEYGPHGREILCRLLIEGALTIDMNQPLSRDTRFLARVGVL